MAIKSSTFFQLYYKDAHRHVIDTQIRGESRAFGNPREEPLNGAQTQIPKPKSCAR